MCTVLSRTGLRTRMLSAMARQAVWRCAWDGLMFHLHCLWHLCPNQVVGNLKRIGFEVDGVASSTVFSDLKEKMERYSQRFEALQGTLLGNAMVGLGKERVSASSMGCTCVGAPLLWLQIRCKQRGQTGGVAKVVGQVDIVREEEGCGVSARSVRNTTSLVCSPPMPAHVMLPHRHPPPLQGAWTSAAAPWWRRRTW